MWTGDLKIISGNNTVTLENSSETPLYATLIRKGVPLLSRRFKRMKKVSA